MNKLTPWFGPEIKPVRIGMYECEMCAKHTPPSNLHYWNGKEWRCSRGDILGRGLDLVTWRGLARKP